MNPLNLGMLVCLSMDWRRLYVGREGVEMVGFRSGTSRWRPLWLWWRGYLQRDGRWMPRGYGSPGVYLVLTPKGREIAERTKKDVARWAARATPHTPQPQGGEG